MYSKWEQDEILFGIEDILFNLRHIPIEDVAYYLVKFSPLVADRLASQIKMCLIDKEIVGE